jgi:hypothetical protein
VGERTIGSVRRPQVLLLATALVLLPAPGAAPVAGASPAAAPAAGDLLVLGRDGRVRAHRDPVPAAARVAAPRSAAAPAPARTRRPTRAASRTRTVPAVLGALLRAGAVDPADHASWRRIWRRSGATLKRLRGTRHAQLRAVRANVATLARTRRLTAPRAPQAFLTLERNRAWWASGPLLSYGRRVGFAGSELVWQFYPGQGIQIQWLGTFGKANGLYLGREDPDRLRALVDEAVALAVPRAGGIAWESSFGFGGGAPQWVSGLTQGTAVQALARAAGRLDDPALMDVARSGLGIFRKSPPSGVRVATRAGAHFAQYSFAPSLRILNGFAQAVSGLHDLAVLSRDEDAEAVFRQGEAQLRAELPAYDTGAWSLYARRGAEADLGYHRLARDFLDGLCDRLTTSGRRGRGLPEPSPYCAASQRFTTYLEQPPALAVGDAGGRRGRRTRIAYAVSKVSTVGVTLLRRGGIAFATTARVGRGRHVVTVWPRKAGPMTIAVRATDLAGNTASATATLRVRPARSPRK